MRIATLRFHHEANTFAPADATPDSALGSSE